MISKKELDILKYIDTHIKENSVAPTFQEIQENFNYKSKRSVSQFIKQLKDKGYIEHKNNTLRGIKVLKTPYDNKITTFLFKDVKKDGRLDSKTRYVNFLNDAIKKKTDKIMNNERNKATDYAMILDLIFKLAKEENIHSSTVLNTFDRLKDNNNLIKDNYFIE